MGAFFAKRIGEPEDFADSCVDFVSYLVLGMLRYKYRFFCR